MGNKNMNDDFPDEKQRAAVCYRQFRKKGDEMNRENIVFVNRPVKLEKVLTEGKDPKVFITGTAIDEGTSRNRVHYSADVLEKATASLSGKPLLRDHNWEDVNSIIGKVTQAEFVNNEILFKAEVDSAESDIIRKMEKGYISSVSVGSLIDPEQVDYDEATGIVTPKKIEFVELSIVTVPGVASASISQVLHEKFSLNKEKEVSAMAENKPELDALKGENEELRSKLAKIDAEKAVKEKEAKEAELSKRIEKLEGAVNDVSVNVKKLADARTPEGLVLPDGKDKKGVEFVWKDAEKKEKGKMFYPKHPEMLY
jgi:regulator of replication initiation timing